jgi:DNA-binding Xre family transcriptional regulator
MTASAPALRLCKALCAVTDNGSPAAVKEFADQWQIDGRLARRAAKGIPINASTFARLCAAVGLDAITGRPSKPEAVTEIDWRLVSAMALMAQIERSLTVRTAAEAWKLSTAAVVRLREGDPVNVENFLAFCKAMGCKPAKFRTRSPLSHVKPSVKQVEHA